MVTNVWSASFAALRFTLSNGGLTAAASAHNQTDTIIAEVHHSTGKWYFEITAGSNGADLGWGIATSSQSNNGGLWSTGVALRNRSSGWLINNVSTATSGPIPNNETLGFAVDFDNSLIWFRQTSAPGTWYGNNATGDPALGTNGLSITTATGFGSEMYIAFTSNQNGVDEASTLNSGGSAFVAAAPAGFLAWEDVVVQNFAQVAQINREILLANDPKAHVAQVNREVLLTHDPKLQAIQVVREVLKSVNIGNFIGLQVDMSEFWFAPGVFMDFSDPANRAKFHVAGFPIPLGNDGSTPTGTPPLLYLQQDFVDFDANDFTLNAAGSGPVTLVTVDGHGRGYGLAGDDPTACTPLPIPPSTIGPVGFYYFEVTVNEVGFEHTPLIGLGGIGFQLQDPIGIDRHVMEPTLADGFFWCLGNSIGFGWTEGPEPVVDIAIGSICGVAVDTQNKRAWIRNWSAPLTTWVGNSPGDPTDIPSGFSFDPLGVTGSPITGQIFILAGDGWDGSLYRPPDPNILPSPSLTLNPTGPFFGTIPVGYSAWQTGPGTTTFDSAEQATQIVLSGGDLTVTLSTSPSGPTGNQPTAFVLSNTSKAQA